VLGVTEVLNGATKLAVTTATLWVAVVTPIALVGCNQGPFLAQQRPGIPTAQPAYSAQLNDLNQRATALDADNRDLHTELARSHQQVQVLQDEVILLREQLGEKANDLREMLAAKEGSEQRVQAIEAATRYRGGATITANSSLRNSLSPVSIQGLEVRRDADLVRIELPADRLFRQNSGQLLPTAGHWLDQVASVVRQAYPRQMIGIEGHTDGAAIGATSSHQLASAQAVAVFNYLARQGRLPERNLFVVGYGASHPRVSNATAEGRSRNRRIEVVVYPEAVD
jgi:flagellar motor protein MotB